MDVIKNYVVIFIITVWYNGFNIHTLTLNESLNGVTWMDANTMCGNQGLEFRKDTLEQITDRQHEFWIGLAVYKIQSWMELKGCGYFFETSQLQDTTNIVMCQQGCKNSKYFAYKIRKCVCISNSIKYALAHISACLKDDDKAYYYLYSHFNGHYTESGDGDCMTIIPNCKNTTVQLRQEDCSSSQISSSCEDGFYYGVEANANQTNTMETCHERQLLLTASLGECSNGAQVPEPVWTNVVRRTYEVESDRLNDIQTPFQCITANVMMENDILTVVKTRRDCNSTFTHFACRFPVDSTAKMSTLVNPNTTQLLHTPVPSMSDPYITTQMDTLSTAPTAMLFQTSDSSLLSKPTLATASNTTLHQAPKPSRISPTTTTQMSKFDTTSKLTSHQPALPSAPTLTTTKSTSATALEPTLRRTSSPASSLTTTKSTSATALKTTLRLTSMPASPASNLTTLKSTPAIASKTTLRLTSVPASSAVDSTAKMSTFVTSNTTKFFQTPVPSMSDITINQSLMTTSNRIRSTLLPITTEPVPTVLQYGTVVGVIICVLIVIAIVSAVIGCRMRSIGIFKNVDMNSNDNITLNEISNASRAPTSILNTNNIRHTDNNVTYAQGFQRGGDEGVNGRNKQIQGDDDPTYSDSRNDEYDLLKDADRRKICMKENLYDSAAGFRNIDDPTYHVLSTFTNRNEECDMYTHVKE